MTDQESQPDPSAETHFETGKPFEVQDLRLPKKKEIKDGAGRRSKTVSRDKRGRYTKSSLPGEKASDIAFDATFRAAAPHQLDRSQESGDPQMRVTRGQKMIIEWQDIREKVREKKIGNLVLFVVDSSGSMGASQRMVAAKGAILSLLVDSYQKRDRVGMVAFKQDRAEVLLPPTNSVELACAKLSELPTGGKTPLSSGLQLGLEIIQKELRKNERLATLMVLVTDGKANVSIQKETRPFDEAREIAAKIKSAKVRSIIIDTETGFVRLGRLQELSDVLGGRYYSLEDIKAEAISALVKEAVLVKNSV